MFSIPRTYFYCWALLPCALGGFVAVRSRQASVERIERFGRFTAQQINDRTEPLCLAVVPFAGCLKLMPEHFVMSRPGRSDLRIWTTDCIGSGGKYVARFVWNADTGELCEVIRATDRSESRLLGVISRQNAIREARRWLVKLGIASDSSRWIVARDVNVKNEFWSFCLRGGDMLVWIEISAGSGNLQIVHSRRVTMTQNLPYTQDPDL